MKPGTFASVLAGAALLAAPAQAAPKGPFCPADLAEAKAVTAPLSMKGKVERNPSSGYERTAYTGKGVTRVGRAVQEVVIERSSNRLKGTGIYRMAFFAPGTATDLLAALKAQFPSTECDKYGCSGSVAVHPGPEGSLEYASLNEGDQYPTVGQVTATMRCVYRDDAYGKFVKEGGLTGEK
jgi:hypothetical protein